MSHNWRTTQPGVEQLPTLYALDSKGGVKEWTVAVDSGPGGSATVITRFGKHGGTIQEQRRPILAGKNLGKSNETTPYAQAKLEAESDYNRKMDKGYAPGTPGQPTQVELPMLALDYHKRGHDISIPCAVQPKLNGVRALALKPRGRRKMMSRMGKEFTTLSHLITEIDEVFEGAIPDGEVYHHGLGFQEIIRRVKKYRPGLTEELQFWAYDLCHSDPLRDFIDRAGALSRIARSYRGQLEFEPGYLGFNWLSRVGKIVFVEMRVVFDRARIKQQHDEYVQEGFEGAILRNMANSPYVFNHRSKDLQKYKEFEDSEYEIVGGEAGTGVEEGCVVFTVKVPGSDKVFNVRPRGTHELRRQWLTELPNLVGKNLTVRYQELSEDGIPIFPVGISIRDYE